MYFPSIGEQYIFTTTTYIHGSESTMDLLICERMPEPEEEEQTLQILLLPNKFYGIKQLHRALGA